MFARSRNNPLGRLAEQLLQDAGRGPRLDAYLRRAASALVALDGVASLALWLDEAGRRYRVSARRSDDSGAVVSLAVEPLSREDFFEDVPRPLLGAVLGRPEVAGRLAHAARSERGSLWVGTDPQSGTVGSNAAAGGFAALVPFGVGQDAEGVVDFVGGIGETLDPDGLERLESAARTLGVALASRRAHAALAERAKELGCIYRIAHLASDPALDLGQMLQAVVDLLPEAWQYPELATARIRLDDLSFVTAGFREGPERLRAVVRVGGTDRGSVEVNYARPGSGDPGSDDQGAIAAVSDDGGFLAEERHLLDAVAREVSFIVERQEVEAERRRLREAVRLQDRLAAIGQLAAGVAHELNEPLSSILGFAQLAAKAEPLADSARNDLARIEAASLYARDIIRNLLQFARQQPTRDAPLQIAEVLDAAIEIVRDRAARARVQIDCQPAAGLPELLGDRHQLQQVAVNLLVNAIQAAPPHSEVRIGASASADGLSWFVADDGPGIAADVREKIFMPFFTTKEVGAGTGLGLAVAHGIVAAHGGRIEVGGDPGARFEVHLPAWRLRRPAS